MISTRGVLAAAAVACGGSLAAAQPFTFVLDASLSSVEATVEVSALNDSDSDTSPLSGMIVLALDGPFLTQSASVIDYAVMADEQLDFSIGGGFTGTIDATVTGLSLALPIPSGVIGPEAVSAIGQVSFANVPAQPGGQGSYSATGLACLGLTALEIPCTDMFGNADYGTQTIEMLDGAITPVSGSRLRLDGSFSTTQPLDPDNPGVATLEAEVSVVAFVDFACVADLDADLQAGANDIALLESRLASADPQADIDGNGATDFRDALLVLFAADLGCD